MIEAFRLLSISTAALLRQIADLLDPIETNHVIGNDWGPDSPGYDEMGQ